MAPLLPHRRNVLATLAVLGILLPPAPGRADLDLPDASLATDPNRALLVSTIPVIPVREREVWFRDTWDVRMNAGYATDKNFGEIVGGSVGFDRGNASLIGIDFGRPLVDDWRDWPMDFAWRLGMQRYLDGGGDANGFAQTAYLKMYWRPFPWDRYVRTRIGFGEGVSYAWSVPEPEREDRGDDSSRFMNYLDVSVDVNVGDLIHNESAHACSLGLVVSHRSGVFGLVDIFGNVHNGSNYNTVAVECGF